MEEKPLPSLKQGLDAVQIDHQGKPMVLLRDQEGISNKPLAITLPAFMIVTLLDGRTKLSTLQTEFLKQTGTALKTEEVQGLIDQMDKCGFLETESLQKKRKQIYDDYLNGNVRKAHHQGVIYPEKTLDIAVALGKFFKDPKGPGKELVSNPTQKEPLAALVAPHIDFGRGGPAYAWAYQALSDTPPPDFIVALGVAHLSPNSPWVMTKKEYETPYGPMKVHNEVYDELDKALWYDGKADELIHRTEHSLEFQALWLKFLWKDKTPPWIPFLCSSFYHFTQDKAPSTIPSIEKGIQDMGAALLKRKKAGEKIMILAGVDLSHVGLRFGDKEPLTKELQEKIEKEDKEALEIARTLKADDFYLSVIKDKHWKKWCGLSALYTTLRLLEILSEGKPLESNILTYDQAEDPHGGVVSFTSITFK